MTSSKPIRSQENKVVMAKLPREDFIKLQKHCELTGESVNSIVRKAVMGAIETPIPHMLAGRNVFLYNRFKDNFRWRVVLDDGNRVDIEEDLPAEYVAQLFDVVKTAVDERNTLLKKEKKDSVPFPSKLMAKRI